MPNIQSARKALRQNVKNRARNVLRKDAYKKALKSYRTLVGQRKMEEANAVLRQAFQSLDKAAKANVIKANKASRLKSRAAQLMTRASRASS